MPPKAKKKPAVVPGSMAALRGDLVKKYGDGRVMRRENVRDYEVIPTGSLSLDFATKVGGLVRGRTHEIVGPEGVGKTTLLILSMANAQRLWPDLAVAYIDMEQTFDYKWAEALGLDTNDDRFLHVYPDDSEDVSDQINMLSRTGLFSMVAIDSIGGMESRQALEKDADEQVVGRNAQIITRMVKKVAVLGRKHKVATVFINQYRANIGGMGGDISAGPKALKYNTTMKIEMKRTSEQPIKIKVRGATKDAQEITIGVQLRARVVRNKVAYPGESGEFWLFNYETDEYGPVGIDQADETITVGIATNVIEQGGGGYYTLPGGERIRGREEVAKRIREDVGLQQQVREMALAHVSGEVVTDIEVSLDEAGED